MKQYLTISYCQLIAKVGLHFDPKYWENPWKFDPERFSAENKGKIDSIVYQPFGAGPRYIGEKKFNGIGIRFVMY